MRGEVTNHVLLGCKSHGGLYYSENVRSEQPVWRANLEARRINEYCSPEICALQKLLKGFMFSADPVSAWGRPMF